MKTRIQTYSKLLAVRAHPDDESRRPSGLEGQVDEVWFRLKELLKAP